MEPTIRALTGPDDPAYTTVMHKYVYLDHAVKCLTELAWNVAERKWMTGDCQYATVRAGEIMVAPRKRGRPKGSKTRGKQVSG